MKNLLFLIAIIPSFLFSQCPDGKSNEYKQKAAQYGDTSYSTLAVYYYYKCQCENGIANRTAEQVNSMVDQYNGLKANRSGSSSISLTTQHQVQWVNISKVSECSSTQLPKENTKTSKRNEPFFTKDFLEENIKNLVNGNTDKALTNINNEIQIKNMMKNSGLDRNTAQGINTMANALTSEIAKAINRPKTPEELKRKFETKFNKKGSSSYFANDTLIRILSTKFGNKTVIYSNKNNGLGRTAIYNSENIIIYELKNEESLYESIVIDYEKNTKEKIVYNKDFDLIKQVNLLTNQTIIDYTNAKKTEEPILNEKGKNIGTKILMDGNLFKTEVTDTKSKTIIATSYHLSKKRRIQISENKRIKKPLEIIEFDENEKIKKKILFNWNKSKLTQTTTDYDNELAVREIQTINGVVIYDKLFD